jgi:hypothetical protein
LVGETIGAKIAMNRITRNTNKAPTAVGLSEKSDQNFRHPDAGTMPVVAVLPAIS